MDDMLGTGSRLFINSSLFDKILEISVIYKGVTNVWMIFLNKDWSAQIILILRNLNSANR